MLCFIFVEIRKKTETNENIRKIKTNYFRCNFSLSWAVCNAILVWVQLLLLLTPYSLRVLVQRFYLSLMQHQLFRLIYFNSFFFFVISFIKPNRIILLRYLRLCLVSIESIGLGQNPYTCAIMIIKKLSMCRLQILKYALNFNWTTVYTDVHMRIITVLTRIIFWLKLDHLFHRRSSESFAFTSSAIKSWSFNWFCVWANHIANV